MTSTQREAGKYELFQLSAGVFVYRPSSPDGRQGGQGGQGGAGPYLCQPCFDAGTPFILEREESVALIQYFCPHCGSRFLERKKPLAGLAMSPWG